MSEQLGGCLGAGQRQPTEIHLPKHTCNPIKYTRNPKTNPAGAQGPLAREQGVISEGVTVLLLPLKITTSFKNWNYHSPYSSLEITRSSPSSAPSVSRGSCIPHTPVMTQNLAQSSLQMRGLIFPPKLPFLFPPLLTRCNSSD